VEGLDPVNRRKARLEKKGTHNIIKGAKRAFGLSILLRDVWTRHAKGQGIVKFAAIVALDALDGGAKLCVNIGKKLERVENVSDFRRRGKVQM
jgi:hypothetical protein